MTIRIELTHGAEALIDQCDAERVLGHRWYCKTRSNGTRYAGTNIRVEGRYRYVSMHRFILAPGAGQVVDHVDGDGLNNTRANLRVCSQSQNMANRRAHGRSKFLGVSYRPGRRYPWAVSCDSRYVGSFEAEEDAAAAYDWAARQAHGPFSRLNFADGPRPFDSSRLRALKAPKLQITPDQFEALRSLPASVSHSEAARMFGIGRQTVSKVRG